MKEVTPLLGEDVVAHKQSTTQEAIPIIKVDEHNGVTDCCASFMSIQLDYIVYYFT